MQSVRSLAHALARTNRDEYQYERFLEHQGSASVRVLALEPAKHAHSRLRGRLQICTLDDIKGKFEALSYTWGPEDFSRYITVNGSKLGITENLYAALVQLRRDIVRPRVLWIDALCINQADPSERTAQVAIMGKIYSTAKRTVSWLGEPKKQSDAEATFDFFKREAARIRSAPHDPPQDFWVRAEAVGDSQRSQGDPRVQANQVLYELLDHVYFSRRWVIQEILLAPEVEMVWGSSRLAWVDLPTVLQQLIFQKFEDFSVGLLAFKDTIRHRHQPGRPNSLALMTRFRLTECRVAHDRIAALQGLWSGRQEFPAAFSVDYTQSVEANYIRFAAMLAQTSECAQLLVSATAFSDYLHELPSWVPDWRATPTVVPTSESILTYSACLGVNNTLVVRGWCIDIVFDAAKANDEIVTKSGFARRKSEYDRNHVFQDDRIFTLGNGNMADVTQFVLRPSPSCAGHYRLVTVCYWTKAARCALEENQQWLYVSEAQEIILE